MSMAYGFWKPFLFGRHSKTVTVSQTEVMSKWENNEEIQILRNYLRIPSVHPNINYGKNLNLKWTMNNLFTWIDWILEPCVEFLKEQAISLGLPVSICYPVNDKNPVVMCVNSRV